MASFVQPGQVDGSLANVHRQHAAAYVHAHDVGHRLVCYAHGGADDAALACVCVGHDANVGAFSKGLVTHGADLFHGTVVDERGKALSRGVLALNRKHIDVSFPLLATYSVHIAQAGCSRAQPAAHCWCPRRDSNSDAVLPATAPEAAASASSATGACHLRASCSHAFREMKKTGPDCSEPARIPLWVWLTS